MVFFISFSSSLVREERSGEGEEEKSLTPTHQKKGVEFCVSEY